MHVIVSRFPCVRAVMMADRAHFEALAKASYLDVLLPKTTDLDVLKLLRSGSPDELLRAPARRNLFFGMIRGLLMNIPLADAVR